MRSAEEAFRAAQARRRAEQQGGLRFGANEYRADVARRLHDLMATFIRDLPDGMQTTTEAALVASLGSSRNAVRDALELLRDNGRVERSRGVGSTVMETRSFGWVDGFSDGEDPRTFHEILHSAVIDNPPDLLAERFQLHEGERLILVERTSNVDDERISVRTIYLRVPAEPAVAANELRGDFYEVVRRLGIEVDSGRLFVSAEVATVRTAQILGVREGDPIFLLENHTSSSDGRLVYLSYGRIRADRFGLALNKTDKRPEIT